MIIYISVVKPICLLLLLITIVFYYFQMFASLLSRIACILVGHVYPLYRTFQVITCLPRKTVQTASINGSSVLDLKRVVAFWTVHGAITFAEFFIDFFLFVIPMYYEAKILFLFWLIHNDFSGALFFFDNFIDEILCKHEREIDLGLENSKKAVRRQLSAGVGALADVAAQAGVAALKKVSDRGLCPRPKRCDPLSRRVLHSRKTWYWTVFLGPMKVYHAKAGTKFLFIKAPSKSKPNPLFAGPRNLQSSHRLQPTRPA